VSGEPGPKALGEFSRPRAASEECEVDGVRADRGDPWPGGRVGISKSQYKVPLPTKCTNVLSLTNVLNQSATCPRKCTQTFEICCLSCSSLRCSLPWVSTLQTLGGARQTSAAWANAVDAPPRLVPPIATHPPPAKKKMGQKSA